jgi:hypothetical protein
LSATALQVLYATHTLFMGGVLIVFSVLASLLSAIVVNNTVISFIFFVVMVGGVLVLFLYMAAISPNCVEVGLAALGLTLLASSIAAFAGFSVTYAQNDSYHVAATSIYSGADFYLVPALAAYLLFAIVIIILVTNKNSGAIRKE